MSYTALYRKWRPTAFSDVKGQDAIVQTLKNQITAQRIGHAYLFCGTRGTGKTSIAKIFARAVLIRTYELVQEGKFLPELIIGTPVGFVNVIQSKELTLGLSVPHIVARGRKGGSNVAAAICNAMLYQIKR